MSVSGIDHLNSFPQFRAHSPSTAIKCIQLRVFRLEPQYEVDRCAGDSPGREYCRQPRWRSRYLEYSAAPASCLDGLLLRDDFTSRSCELACEGSRYHAQNFLSSSSAGIAGKPLQSRWRCPQPRPYPRSKLGFRSSLCRGIGARPLCSLKCRRFARSEIRLLPCTFSAHFLFRCMLVMT